jgi:hypothetical protein
MGAFLLAMVGPLVRRALVSLGVGVLSYAAVSVALNAALASAKAAWAGLTGDTLALIQMAGVSTAASILAGALVARVALQFTKKLGYVK